MLEKGRGVSLWVLVGSGLVPKPTKSFWPWCLLPRATFPPHHTAETVSHSVRESRHTCLGLLGMGSQHGLSVSSFLDAALQYEPVITAGNEALVHHMEVFQCAAEFDSFPHYNGPCDSKMKPDRLNYCRHVLAAWAMGAQVGARWVPLPWVTALLLGAFLLPPNPSRSHLGIAPCKSAEICVQPCLSSPPMCLSFHLTPAHLPGAINQCDAPDQ